MSDVPVWVGSVGTAGALFAALAQIGYERRRRLAREASARAAHRREQAQLISAWLGPAEESADGQWRTAIHLLNGSHEPVYTLLVCIVFIQGAAPRDAESMIELRNTQWPGEPMPLTTVSLLPPGSWRTWIPGTGWTAIMAGRGGVDAAFTDRAGAHWIRRALGELRELAEPPLKHFENQGLYGPYDLQAPEPDE